ncbi:hypothetical protein BT61P2_00017 [Bacteroides phage BT61P2]|nr:hypothetical protein BT61P1_00016 [Bacteroides phage BT61P1]WAX09089.1 hypothetical protein BT61P2_00017 [Bacteroides phage BT61P2]
MKKFTLVFIVLIAAFAASSIAQIKEGPKPEQIGSYRMGIIKLYKTGDSYEIKGQTKQFVDTRLIVTLGSKEQATEILQSMVNYKGESGTSLDLNNPGMNVARWMGSMLGGWEIGITGMYATSIMVSKGELKKMIKVIIDKP